jgi:hypothetical protein
LTDERFLVMRAADGTRLYVDVAGAQRRTLATLAAGDRVSAAGVEGERPYELRATVLAAGTAESSPAPPAPAAPPPSASPATAPAEPERIDGRIESLTGTRLMLRRDDGESVSVDLSRVAGNSSVGAGADVTVFGVREADGRFVATGLVGRERSR